MAFADYGGWGSSPASFFVRNVPLTDYTSSGFPNSIIYKATHHEVYMIFYRNEPNNRLLSFTAVFNVAETELYYATKLMANIIASIPMDSYNQSEQKAISEMLNRSSAIGRVITVIAVDNTPQRAINFIYDKIQEAALKQSLNVLVTCLPN